MTPAGRRIDNDPMNTPLPITCAASSASALADAPARLRADATAHPQTPLAGVRIATRMHGMRSSAVRDLLAHAKVPGMISFAGGLPAPETFDVDGIRAASLAALDDPHNTLQYGTTDGQPGLRALIATHLTARGVPAAADALIVTTGSQQGIDLLARVLLDPGDTVIVERPTYLAALQVFTLAQVNVLGLETDADGACTDRLDALDAQALRRGWRRPRAIYLVPEFGNPSGTRMSIARRQALLRWAVAHDVVVIEDAPYSELRFDAGGPPTLWALARSVPGATERVVQLSTLSKTIAPGLRVGWMAAPEWLRAPAVLAKQSLDLHTSTLSQEVAAHYLRTGRLEAHLQSVRRHYAQRCAALCAALQARFGRTLRFEPPPGGMFVWARFEDAVDTTALLPHALERGVMYVPGEAFYAEDPDRQTLRLAYATVSPERIREGVDRLASALDAYRSTR